MSLTEKTKTTLLDIAVKSIRHGLDNKTALSVNPLDYDDELQLMRASFVTLHINSVLRGCIGSLSAYRPLVQDVSANAFAAAFSDPRFPPVNSADIAKLDYHISVLTEATPMVFNSEEELLQQIRPGIDGLILNGNGRRGTFLPSVWETLPNKRDFLNQLKLKAGLPSNYWSDNVRVERYTTESFA